MACTKQESCALRGCENSMRCVCRECRALQPGGSSAVTNDSADEVMTTPKQSAKELLELLPDEATWDDIMYGLYVRQKIEKGLADMEAGRSVSLEEAKRRLLGREA